MLLAIIPTGWSVYWFGGKVLPPRGDFDTEWRTRRKARMARPVNRGHIQCPGMRCEPRAF